MRTRVQKWGNSLAVRIPKPFADEAGLRQSSEVDVSLEKGAVLVVPVRHRWRLDELLARVTKGNLQEEADWGPAAGREAW